MNQDSITDAVILDTDIGTDVDDVVALGLLLRAPNIDLRAVTTVYVDAALRARIVRRVLEVAGRTEIPIGCGLDRPLLQRDALFWEGWEGEGFLGNGDDGASRQQDRHDGVAKGLDTAALPHAVDLLVETVLAHPGEITVLAIGPLTNLAVALLREPRFAQAVRRIAIMGGMVQRRLDQLSFPYVEHNIRCDPEAAEIVFASRAPITLVPLDVTTQVYVRRPDLARMAGGDDLGALVADQLDRYMTHKGRDWIHPHDALTATAIVRPELLRTVPLRVDVETRGALTRGQTVAVHPRGAGEEARPVDVALEVDAASFDPWLVEMLAGSAATAGRATR